MMESIARRLAAKAIKDISGCWEWQGAKDGAGYGLLSVNGRTLRAHRLSFETHRYAIPAGMVVCHRCDNPACIEPSHLFLGTQADNVADRDAKGRHARLCGEKHGCARLTEADVLAIRAAKGGWGLGRRLAKQFGISTTQISSIRLGRNWAHLDESTLQTSGGHRDDDLASAQAQLEAAKKTLKAASR